MKKSIIIILLYLLTNTLFAQVNLVPNGDFEIYSSLPDNIGESNLAIGWNNVNGNYPWVSGYGTPDYYNTAGFMTGYNSTMLPFSGNGQMAFVTYQIHGVFREYISTQLTSSMVTGHNYTISFYLTNGLEIYYTNGSNNLGICFSNNPLYQATDEAIPVAPQIEIDTIIYIVNYWQHFSFNYTADSPYNYITIGNFKDDAHTLVSTFGSTGAYYFIDKIEIYPTGIYIEGDSVICVGNIDTLKIHGDSIVKWANSLNPAIIIATDSIITVVPTATTTYMAYSNNDTAYYTVHVLISPNINLGNDTMLCNGQIIILNATNTSSTYHWQDSTTYATYNVTQAGIYWVKVTNQYNCSASDTINIMYKDCEDTLVIPNIFTPNGDNINDYFVIKNSNDWDINLQVFNRWGNLVYKEDNYQNNWDGKYKGNPLSDGVYYYIINAKGKYSGTEEEHHGSLTILR